MIGRLRDLIVGRPETPSAGKNRIQIATAVLLLEMAHSDEEFQDMEAVLIRDLLQNRFGLSETDTAELVNLAQKQRQTSLDLFQFAQEINDYFSIAEKLEIMEGLWRIIYADGVLDKYEDYLVRKMATLLRLSHRQMIEAKVKILDEVRPDR